MKRYEITCDFNWEMREMSDKEHYYENVQGSPLIRYSTCVEVERDEDIAFNRGRFRILDLIEVPKDPPFETSPKLEKVRKEILARANQRKVDDKVNPSD